MAQMFRSSVLLVARNGADREKDISQFIANFGYDG
jgi:hypothetical protein